MPEKTASWNKIGWMFGILFLVIGVLNMILIHAVPGLFYIVLSLLYLPPAHGFLKERVGFSIPRSGTVVLALLVLWATLAVGDLMELFESWALK